MSRELKKLSARPEIQIEFTSLAQIQLRFGPRLKGPIPPKSAKFCHKLTSQIAIRNRVGPLFAPLISAPPSPTISLR